MEEQKETFKETVWRAEDHLRASAKLDIFAGVCGDAADAGHGGSCGDGGSVVLAINDKEQMGAIILTPYAERELYEVLRSRQPVVSEAQETFKTLDTRICNVGVVTTGLTKKMMEIEARLVEMDKLADKKYSILDKRIRNAAIASQKHIKAAEATLNRQHADTCDRVDKNFEMLNDRFGSYDKTLSRLDCEGIDRDKMIKKLDVESSMRNQTINGIRSKIDNVLKALEELG